jgi:uncharacterized membrane protein YcaP (DUF421 family)
MNELLRVKWHEMFVPEMSIPEILIRGVAVYVSLCLLLRVILKRQAGKVSISDLLVITIIAGVARNPLAGQSQSIPDGLLVIATVLGCSYAMDWLSYHSPFIHSMLHSDPVILIRDGKLVDENLRRELITKPRLQSQLRQRGIDDVAEVKTAVLEGSGEISVIRKQASWATPQDPSPKRD